MARSKTSKPRYPGQPYKPKRCPDCGRFMSPLHRLDCPEATPSEVPEPKPPRGDRFVLIAVSKERTGNRKPVYYLIDDKWTSTRLQRLMSTGFSRSFIKSAIRDWVLPDHLEQKRYEPLAVRIDLLETVVDEYKSLPRDTYEDWSAWPKWRRWIVG